MACSSILDGSMLRLYIQGELVAKDTSSDLSIDNNVRETTSKTSGDWQSFVKGIKGWTISGEALVLSETASVGSKKTAGDIYAYLVGGAAVTVKLATPVATDGYYEGSAIFNNMSINSGNSGDNVTYSFSLQGTGELEFKTS